MLKFNFRSVAALCVATAALFVAPPSQAGDRTLFGDFGVVGKNADRWEARLGIASYDTGVFSHKAFDGVVVNGEILAPSPDFLYGLGSPRPYVGFDAAIADDPVHFFYTGLNWETYFTDRLYLSNSLGGAIHTADKLEHPDGDYKALGCRALFHLGIGVGYDLTRDVTAQLYADHFSNADLCDKNNGAESAGIRVGYRF
ncbi:acyloxyacyl hydrolase [Consotaella aegiceratis]|uniref:acyloxyacyl hydrolase n=1 Tax=Consotaella aegiceratis TaxID=3097961 RepID=UPI002F3EED86